MQVIGTVTAGLAVVAIVGPAFAASQLQVSCLSSPRDATAGEPLLIQLIANRPLRCMPFRPLGGATTLPRSEALGVTITPPQRGVLPAVRVRLATAAPLGLLWWSVERLVPLPTPISVAPRLGHGPVERYEAQGQRDGRGRPVLAQAGEIRGVRAYRYGDSRRRVHWRASAHTGLVMVRELEELPGTPLRIVADLSEDPIRAEEQSADVLGAVAELLAAGKTVTLETLEHGQKVYGEVSDRVGAGRRLARAGVNPYNDLEADAAAASGAAAASRSGR